MSDIPTTVKFKEPTKQRLTAFLKDKPQLGYKDVIDFAVFELLNSIDGGAKLTFEGPYGLQLSKPEGMQMMQSLGEVDGKSIAQSLKAIEMTLQGIAKKSGWGAAVPPNADIHEPGKQHDKKKKGA